jgi:predicted glycoside hydrolase/deacetylase ChbG (UPF0249 family)
MAGDRYLIVNADDFGQTAGVNSGVIEAHERGIVTSASLMVRWPAAADAAEYARAHPALDLGLHLDLGEWAVRNGEWVPAYEVVSSSDPSAVAAEIENQVDRFLSLVGRPPTHLDSHQHVHKQEPTLTVARAIARRLGVPLRHDTDVCYCGSFYGQSRDGSPHPDGISVAGLIGILHSLGPGVTELSCHPGLCGDVDSMYNGERAVEIQTLCDPEIRKTILDHSIELVTFGNRLLA